MWPHDMVLCSVLCNSCDKLFFSYYTCRSIAHWLIHDSTHSTCRQICIWSHQISRCPKPPSLHYLTPPPSPPLSAWTVIASFQPPPPLPQQIKLGRSLILWVCIFPFGEVLSPVHWWHDTLPTGAPGEQVIIQSIHLKRFWELRNCISFSVSLSYSSHSGVLCVFNCSLAWLQFAIPKLMFSLYLMVVMMKSLVHNRNVVWMSLWLLVSPKLGSLISYKNCCSPGSWQYIHKMVTIKR